MAAISIFLGRCDWELPVDAEIEPEGTKLFVSTKPSEKPPGVSYDTAVDLEIPVSVVVLVLVVEPLGCEEDKGEDEGEDEEGGDVDANDEGGAPELGSIGIFSVRIALVSGQIESWSNGTRT